MTAAIGVIGSVGGRIATWTDVGSAARPPLATSDRLASAVDAARRLSAASAIATPMLVVDNADHWLAGTAAKLLVFPAAPDAALRGASAMTLPRIGDRMLAGYVGAGAHSAPFGRILALVNGRTAARFNEGFDPAAQRFVGTVRKLDLIDRASAHPWRTAGIAAAFAAVAWLKLTSED